MAATRLLVGVVLALGSAALWVLVGLVLWRQPRKGPGGVARRRFAVWWIALAAYTAVNAALGLAVLAGSLPVWALDGVVVCFAALIVVMFWGLTSYVAYLVTGKTAALRAATWIYALQLVALLAVVVALDPRGAHVEGSGVALEYAHGDFVAANAVFALVFLLPPLFASIAYLALWIRVRDPAARLRIAIVGGSIALWLLNALVSARAPADADALQVTLRALGVLIALGPLLAYRPPRALAHRFPMPPAEVAREQARPEDEARSRAALLKRVKQLI